MRLTSCRASARVQGLSHGRVIDVKPLSCALALLLLLAALQPAHFANAATRKAVPAATFTTAVIPFTVIRAEEALPIVQRFYPRAHIIVDRNVNAVVVSASPDDLNAIRQMCAGIDSKSAISPTTQSLSLHRMEASDIAARLRALYPDAKFSTVGRRILLVSANNAEMQQIQSVVSVVDAPLATPTPQPLATPPATEAVHVFQAPARQVAREVAGAVHGLRISVAGQAIVLAGSPDLITRAKDIIAVLDAPAPTQHYTAVYRIHTLDAQSVGDLIQRSFPDAKVTVDADINALSVLATPPEQQRIADAIAKLDSAGTSASGAPSAVQTSTDTGVGSVQIYNMRAAVPGANNSPSTTANDLATLVTQALQPQAPDLHINVSPDSPQLILTGNPYSIKLAKDLLSQLDVSQQLVVLDTEILEMDENTAKNLGVSVSSINGGPFSIGTIFTESSPPPDPSSGIVPILRRLQPLYRTPIAFGDAINLAIQHGNARVLADPRITTLSGHTATIRAGDNISIPLTTGGGAGTIATTQIQTFQTGVTLDITPIVNADGLITVALHPVVNSLTGILNGVPQISTRDTQTTVALREDQTLVIGGLIQDNTQRTESKVPVLGDLPLVGHVFRNQTLNGDRNELIISVTPHILSPGQTSTYPGPPLPAIPTPAPLPTLPPGAALPTPSPSLAPTPLITPGNLTRRVPRPILIPTPVPLVSPFPSVVASATPSQPSGSNVFAYGSEPPSNDAGAADPPKIYYAVLSPTILTYGTPVQINVTTSTNVAQLSLRYNGVATSISQIAPGKFTGTFPFTLVGTPGPTGPIVLILTANKADGTSATLPVPVTIRAGAGSE